LQLRHRWQLDTLYTIVVSLPVGGASLFTFGGSEPDARECCPRRCATENADEQADARERRSQADLQWKINRRRPVIGDVELNRFVVRRWFGVARLQAVGVS